MGASFYWQAVSGTELGVDAPSSFLMMLRKAFGNEPWTLTTFSIERLEGMAAADETHFEALHRLIDAIHTHGAIRVWGESR